MSQLHAFAMDKWKLAILRFDRPTLLEGLGLEFDTPMVGDAHKLRSLQLEKETTLKVHRVHAPFLRCSDSVHCCEGALLRRSNRTTVAIPCLSTELVEGAKVCAHCEQLWAVADDDGWYKLDAVTMPLA